jgi:hypothetical protein
MKSSSRAGKGADDLAALAAAMDDPVDYSDIPGRRGPGRRVVRDANGQLPVRPPNRVRDAILARLDRLKMTRYQLWKEASARCETLSQSAVYEYLRGQRDIGTNYLMPMLDVIGLEIGPPARKTRMTPGAAARKAAKVAATRAANAEAKASAKGTRRLAVG